MLSGFFSRPTRYRLWSRRYAGDIRGQQFRGGDGIVSKGVENTLQNVGRLGKEGMRETNEEIIKMMIED